MALQRATQVHCRSRPEAHLFAARFHEQQGDVAAARASLEHVTDQLAKGNIKVPCCVECRMHSCLENLLVACCWREHVGQMQAGNTCSAGA